MNKTSEYEIGFSMAKNMVGDTAIEMLRRIGSPQSYFELSRSQLCALAGVESKIFDDNYRKELLMKAQTEVMFTEHSNISASFWGSVNYPHRLQECQDAPVMLYQLGHANLNLPHVLGVVGTRHGTPYGIDFTKKVVKDLAVMFPDLIIVSGLAYGIDVTAHLSAIDNGLATVAVLAHGLDMIYPAQHRSIAAKIIEKGGALLTEYPSHTKIYQRNFLSRNRIVAGLCDCILVVESDYRGGSMSTARTAALYNRDVFALPGRINDTYSRGTNKLIIDNIASMVTSADDIVKVMGWEPVVRPNDTENPQLFKPLTAEQQTLVDFIKSNPDATVNDMCIAMGVNFSSLSNLLFVLEEEDILMQLPGGRYAVTI